MLTYVFKVFLNVSLKWMPSLCCFSRLGVCFIFIVRRLVSLELSMEVALLIDL